MSQQITKWEHTRLQWYYGSDIDSDIKTFGLQGWQMCAYDNKAETFWFKRPIQEETKPTEDGK